MNEIRVMVGKLCVATFLVDMDRDCTMQFQAAIDYATQVGGIVEFPEGKYILGTLKRDE